MADTTADIVKEIAPHLSTVSDALFALILEDAARKITAATYGTDEEEAQRNWVAHVLTEIQNSADGGVLVTEEIVDRVEVKFGALKGIDDANRYDTTPYGVRYNTLRRSHIMALQVGN